MAAIDDVASIEVEPWLWGGFLVGILVLIAIDLLLHRKEEEVKPREAVLLSVFWIGLALAFNAWFAWRYGSELGLQFLTAYVVEKSLSVDNLFVMLLVFQSFRIPALYQHRVLFWGILGAIVMRGIVIIAGARLVAEFDWILYIFGVILLISAVRFFTDSDDTEEVRENWVVKLVRRYLPITETLQGRRFFIRRDGRTYGTPLLVVLIVIEGADLIFAVDSIPAVFSVTQHPFVAFASNILAILGLRALYFVIADWVAKLRYLKPGLAAVLGFIGLKMLLVELFHIPSWVSLLVIIGILTTAALTSWYVARVEAGK